MRQKYVFLYNTRKQYVFSYKIYHARFIITGNNVISLVSCGVMFLDTTVTNFKYGDLWNYIDIDIDLPLINIFV